MKTSREKFWELCQDEAWRKENGIPDGEMVRYGTFEEWCKALVESEKQQGKCS